MLSWLLAEAVACCVTVPGAALLKNVGFIDSGGHFHTFPLEGAQNTLIQGVLQ